MTAISDFAIEAGDGAHRLRRTALLLHGLSADDREWVLANLPRGQADQLRDLLRELTELGMPAEGSLVRSVLTRSPGPTPEPRHEHQTVLKQASATQLHACLSTESDRLIAAVTCAAEWAWTDELLMKLGQARGEAIRELVRTWRPPRALQNAALKSLERRVQQLPSSQFSPLLNPREMEKRSWLPWPRRRLI